MSIESRSGFRIFLATLIFLIFAGDALAQGAFKGEWYVVDANQPDWLGPALAKSSSDKDALLEQKVEIRSDAIVSAGPLACAQASYQIVSVGTNDLFQGRAGNSAEDAAGSAGITPKSRTLRVTCNSRTIDYHEAGDSLVVLVGDHVYTLAREIAR